MEALIGAFVPMTAVEQQLVAAAYRLLGDAAPVDLPVIADAAGWPAAAVDARLESWHGVYIDGDSRLVGLGGMAVEAVSPHVLHMAGREPVWMWCALDPLFIVPLLGLSEADVSSICPATGGPIRLDLGAEGVERVEPASTVVTLLMPDGPFDADVRQTFCHFVHFFASVAADGDWVAGHPGTFWLPLPEAIQVGRRLGAGAFPALSVR